MFDGESYGINILGNSDNLNMKFSNDTFTNVISSVE